MTKKTYQQKGFILIWMLFIIFLMGLFLAKSLDVYSTNVQRSKEAELIEVGLLYKQALYNYYINTPNTQNKSFPKTLQELLKDPRYLTPQRYIRKLYLDPITNKGFSLIHNQNGEIIGVYSSSKKRPMKQKNFPPEMNVLISSAYQDWLFVATINTQTSTWLY